MRTREELIKIVNSDLLNENKLSSEEFKLINGDDFESAEKLLKFTALHKEEVKKMVEYCKKNMKRDLDL